MKSIGVLFFLAFATLSLLFACGKGKGEKKPSAEKPAVVPATPAGISTVSGDGMVTVRWSASPGAESYTLYYAEQAGAKPEQMAKAAGITATSYDHKGLKNGAVYYYRVSSTSRVGESAPSGETGARPKAVPPSAPAGVAAMGGNGKISLKWIPVAGAEYYNVYFSTKPQVAKNKRTKVPMVRATPYEHRDVKKKMMYFYVVSAVNGGGESPLSAESGAMP